MSRIVTTLKWTTSRFATLTIQMKHSLSSALPALMKILVPWNLLDLTSIAEGLTNGSKLLSFQLLTFIPVTLSSDILNIASELNYRDEEIKSQLTNLSFRYTAISVVEMDFERIDINQCPKGEGNKGSNRFVNTARCKTESTEVSWFKCLMTHRITFYIFSVNLWMFGAFETVAINVVVNRNIDCPAWYGNRFWEKFWRGRAMNNTTPGLIALRLDVSLHYWFWKYRSWTIFSLRDSKNSDYLGASASIHSREISRSTSRI